MLKIAHIINPVKVGKQSDLYVAQPITFETMRRAKDHAQGRIDVELFTAQYAEDREIIPEFFTQTPDLERSVLDVGQFKKQRKLPLIKDILDRLYEAAPNADYLIYTNADIALQPHFYTAIQRFIEKGYEAFVINRRTIPKELNTREQIPEMYAQIGKIHPGVDCFIFNRNLYPCFNLGNACIGANYIGKVINLNLQVFTSNYYLFKDLHVTFHIGDDRSWNRIEYNDFDIHNKTVLLDIYHNYKKNGQLKNKQIQDSFLNRNDSAQKRKKSYFLLLKQKICNRICLQKRAKI